MRLALRLLFRSLGDVWFNVTGYIECNVPVAVTLLISPAVVAQLSALGVPSALVGVLQLAVVAGVGGPLLLGLNGAARAVTPYNERPDVFLLLRSARARMRQGVVYGLLLAVGTLVIGSGLVFYLSVPQAWALIPLAFSLVILLFLLGVGLYTPAFLARSEAGLLTALRNSAISALRYPGLTWTLILLSVAILLVSAVLVPVLLLSTFSLLAVLWTRAVDAVLELEGILPPGLGGATTAAPIE